MLELNLTGKRRITYRHTIKRKCLCCGKIFEKPAWYGKGYYCSKECADIAKKANHKPDVVCEYCGKKFYRKPSQIAKTKHNCCSKQCMGNLRKSIYSGENNPNFNNRKDRIKDYIQGRLYYDIHVENHPFSHKCHNIGSYYKEHRYIVEQNYQLFDEKYFVIIDGKHYLKPEISVHHINEITTDNRIENLVPMTKSEHTSEHNKTKIISRDKLGRITGVFKRGELLETCNGNQQPSTPLTKCEGSETNS